MDVKRLQRRLADAGYYRGAIDGALGRRSYAALFGYMARKELGEVGLAFGDGCAAEFRPAGLTSGLRIAHFLAQTATETGGFKALEENLRYSAKRLMATWPSRFPDLASTKGYVMRPEALAAKVYSDRLGNGPASSGDGWTFRGRGLIQLTGRANYAARATETGIPLVDFPDYAADPKLAVRIAALYWTARSINDAADADDVARVRRLVNGGAIGLADAEAHLSRARKLLL